VGTLQGRLVRLRPLELNDASRFTRWFNDQEVAGFLIADRYPITRLQEERFIREHASVSYANGVIFAMEKRGDSKHIGWCGLFNVQAENRQAELAVGIGEKEFWSQGYGGDAVTALLDFGFCKMNLHRGWLTTVEYNTRDIACYRRCGFIEEVRMRQHVYRHGRYWNFIQMGILQHEFERRAGGEGA
jgi:RimJ/RimL family protein N-acetyltransferase